MLDQYVSWGEAHTNCWMEVDNIFAIVVIVEIGFGTHKLLDGGQYKILVVVEIVIVNVFCCCFTHQLLDGGQNKIFAIVEIK